MNVSARLVYDSAQVTEPRIPPEMGTPSFGQFTGTWLEQLGEIACRVCYDSFGKGRPAEALHKHILEVKNLSVYEHCAITLEGNLRDWQMPCLFNRPGLFVRAYKNAYRVTLNPRVLLDWWHHDNCRPNHFSLQMLHAFVCSVQVTMPRLFSQEWVDEMSKAVHDGIHFEDEWRVVLHDLSEDERWLTFWLRGSRGFSHELVRHGDFTAISQRSTRYVDESESEMLWHPEIYEKVESLSQLGLLAMQCRDVYRGIVEELEAKGCDRKTARGAARGALPNALETQVVFSASLRQWRWMFDQRCSPYADGEIRQIMGQAKEIVDAIAPR